MDSEAAGDGGGAVTTDCDVVISDVGDGSVIVVAGPAPSALLVAEPAEGTVVAPESGVVISPDAIATNQVAAGTDDPVVVLGGVTINDFSGAQEVFVQDSQPADLSYPFIWVQTGLGAGDDFSIWFNEV